MFSMKMSNIQNIFIMFIYIHLLDSVKMRKIHFLNLEDVNTHRCICEAEWTSISDVAVTVVCLPVGITDLTQTITFIMFKYFRLGLVCIGVLQLLFILQDTVDKLFF